MSPVFVYSLEDKKLEALGDGGMPSFSPVSDELLVTKHKPNWGTFWTPKDGGEPVKLVHAIGAIWAADGSRIAFLTPPGKGIGIFDRESEELRPISAQLHHGGSWSPDGTRFCGIRATDDDLQELVVISVDDETLPETVLLKARM